jgi:ATP-dependent DNA ligase
MKSWAVPKGPSYDTHDKRMAVHVEDHPISYSDFEGTIPPQQYGAGKVIIWDKGTWTPLGDPREGFAKGEVKFEIHGHKMHGRWVLVRMRARAGERQESWLLIKENDEYARPAVRVFGHRRIARQRQGLADAGARRPRPRWRAGGRKRRRQAGKAGKSGQGRKGAGEGEGPGAAPCRRARSRPSCPQR